MGEVESVIKPHGLLQVTMREAAELLGVRYDRIYKKALERRQTGRRIREVGSRYVVKPGAKRGQWATTYYFGDLRRLITGQWRAAA